MKHVVLFAVIVACTLAQVAAAAELQSINGAALVSGGVGEDERAEMEALLPDYNLKLRTVARSGQYLSGARAELRDARKARVFETLLDGPWLLARVPAGRYELRLTYGAITQVRQVTIPATGRRELILYWDSSAVPDHGGLGEGAIFFSEIPRIDLGMLRSGRSMVQGGDVRPGTSKVMSGV